MGKFINGNVKEFWGGTIAGGVTGGGFIFAQNIIFLDFLVKLLATGLFAAISGLATVLVADLYKHKIKHKIFKKKNNGSTKHDEEKAA